VVCLRLNGVSELSRKEKTKLAKEVAHALQNEATVDVILVAGALLLSPAISESSVLVDILFTFYFKCNSQICPFLDNGGAQALLEGFFFGESTNLEYLPEALRGSAKGLEDLGSIALIDVQFYDESKCAPIDEMELCEKNKGCVWQRKTEFWFMGRRIIIRDTCL
jgi:hypothetical protein